MADKVKGITIEFRGDTTQLDKALRQIRNDAKDIDAELREVNRLLKFNPGNTELLAQKQKLLKGRVEQTEKSLKDLKAVEKQLEASGVDKQSEEWRRVRRSIIETESKLKHFRSELAKVNAQASKLNRVGRSFQAAGRKITAAGQALRGLSMAAAGAVAGLGAAAYKAGQLADDLNTLSKQTGINTYDLQMYAATADLVDVSVEDMAKGQQRLKRSMLTASEGGSTLDYFKELGVEVTDSNGELRDANDVFNDTVEALGKMENTTRRDAVAMALMGKSATNLNPLIEDGGETYKRVSEMMEKYGLSPVSQEDLDRANEFNDTIDMIKIVVTRTIQNVGMRIAGELVPKMQKLVEKIGEIGKWFNGLSGDVLVKFGAIMTAVALLSPALIILGKVITAVGTALKMVGTVIGAVGKAMTFLAANPVVLVIAGIAALVAAFVLLWNKSEKFRQFFLNMWDSIKKKVATVVAAFTSAKTSIVNAWKNLPETFQRIWNSIGTGLKNLGSKVANAVVGSIKSGINAVITNIENIVNKAIGLVNSAIKLANKLPGVNVGYVSELSLPRLAKGGLLNGAQTVIAGEAGPEAIIPLDRLFAQMDKMAAQITGAGEGVTIIVNGAVGQNVEELAAAVERRLIETQKRRRLAWQ